MKPYEPTPERLERDTRSVLLVLAFAHAYLDWRDGPYIPADNGAYVS
jgi:hypothetical protein